MPFRKENITEIIEQKRKENPDFKKVWDETREAYRLIGEMVSLRKKEKLTQSQLAAMTGNHQQVISRIEKHENMPSLKLFCNLLNALGYEMRITKK